MLKSWASGLPTCRRAGVSFLFRGGALAHPRAVVPEIRADCSAVGPDLPGDFPDDSCSFSSEANVVLQEQLGAANAALRAKEADCSKLAAERDLLATQLAEQKALLKKAQEDAKRKEAALQAEFEAERASWTDKEAMLTSGFHEIEDIVDGEFLLACFFERPTMSRADSLLFLTCLLPILVDFFPGPPQAAVQAIVADREKRRAAGEDIAANAPRTLDEQLMSIEARLRPAHRMLRRL